MRPCLSRDGGRTLRKVDFAGTPAAGRPTVGTWRDISGIGQDSGFAKVDLAAS